jgi:heme/copper-type cytochrome/quinol oxidase subunit 3
MAAKKGEDSMSVAPVDLSSPPPTHHRPPSLPLDESRGRWAMVLTILTEGFLFISLFSSYFFLAIGKQRWKIENPPKLHWVIPMLIILLFSSVVLHWGEKQVKKENFATGRMALVATVVLGLVFLVLSGFDYREHWQTLTPMTDSYGSIFYTLVSFHAAHVIVGLLILGYVFFIPRYAPADRTPYKPYHVASLYWHFVDVVWVFIVFILYITPNVVRS